MDRYGQAFLVHCDRDKADIETREFVRDLAEIRKFLSIH